MNIYLILKTYYMAIALDTDNKCLLSYNYQDGQINISSKGILTTVNTELGEMLESFFKIELSDYGVELYDELFSLEVD
ncbi:MAG: hypothetical protein COT46_04395 [Sulfurimonas sp. CG08_land_8_20_14_0_20_36_33]|nr:hypothetical protein [Campylobacterota bacterium]PIP11005.1 MAG: hypothetical protein COX50_02910 [Sulfurimonas sp. CG23_combo_of_CG06-09_8_20_14_all_36_33]PIS25954.1 MAG: hypothetical protein COT46_04395 [Sulfurimonas sp. CG08_land_8_20_14_0_20_36_33]PIV04245.1 MAG: hypothetical protein COS56_05650 [Sulfurimonas sp. CG03_land_8_20_14_0_80_36_25]PIV34490.1 MAG: hypothetical protein COS32_09885 [Sulfurimonas sp. CG02_land_8_20_14_3_00_36_67]PIW24267.1 MAG: hypothetical protein COW31_07250 [S